MKISLFCILEHRKNYDVVLHYILISRMYDLSVKNRVVLKTGYNLRFDDGIMLVKKILKKRHQNSLLLCKMVGHGRKPTKSFFA